jgi:phosphatidate cytidylyltransferase
MLSLRIASAVVGLPVLFLVAVAGGPLYGLVMCAATFLGAWEIRGMLKAAGHRPLDPVILGFSVLLPLDAWFLAPARRGEPLFAADGTLLVGVLVLGSLMFALLRRRAEGAMVDWSLSIAGALYVGGLMQFYAPLRDRPDGAFWVLTVLGLSFLCDSAAFFAGRAFGRTPLAPRISPRKSLEGAAAGLLVTPLVGALFAPATGRAPALLAALGLAIAVATIAGDLAESMLKRQTGVKDSGGLVPGHGGILDRMDSLLFCAPVAVLFLRVAA